jgi:hypothetical protein
MTGADVPEQTPLSVAISYLTVGSDQLLADADPDSAALFTGVECLEIISQLSEIDDTPAPAVTATSTAEALSLAADLLSRDGRAALALVAIRVGQLSHEVN